MIKSKIKTILKASPYTRVTTKMMSFLSPPKNKDEITDNITTKFKSRMILGRNTMLVGIFCPIFWISLFAGASRGTILFNAFHSAIVIIVGIIILLINYWSFVNQRKNQ